MKKSFNETCTTDYECNWFINLKCSSSLICDCNSTQFWNGSNCENKRVYNESCLSTYWCNTAINNLNCIQQTWSQDSNAGLCRCTSSQYYDTTSKLCKSVGNYGTTGCTQTLQCNTLVGLQCISSTCTCNTTSQYYDGTKCATKVTYSSSCQNKWVSAISMYVPRCDDLDGLICSSSTWGTCTCPSTQFWSNNKCTAKLLNGAQCTSVSECDSSKNLDCLSGYCQCSSSSYWTGSTCSMFSVFV